MNRQAILAVDLDGTLLKTDLLYESLWKCASEAPWHLSSVLKSVTGGKARFKQALSAKINIDPKNLAYNSDVIAYVRSWRENGGKAILVTASDQRAATDVADYLGIFDDVFGSDGDRNLRGEAKANFLKQKFGVGGYDYMGDSPADLPVWQAARRAIAVGVPEKLRARITPLDSEVVLLPARSSGPGAHWRALRPHQWLKNLLVFLPLLAVQAESAALWMLGVLAFLAFSLVASGVYVLNDLLDLAADRAHPRKNGRPIASGAVSLFHATIMAAGAPLAGLLLAILTGQLMFIGVLSVYYVMSVAYSLVLKRMLVVDICTLAGLYTIRIIGGAAVTGLSPSVWLLAFSVFIFLSLAAVKRQTELVDAAKTGRMSISGRGYEPGDLPIISMMAVSAGYVAVLVMALYLYSPTVQELYRQPMLLWGVCPILIYWVSWMVMTAHRGRMDDDPIVFAVKDRVSRYCGALVFLCVVAASQPLVLLD